MSARIEIDASESDGIGVVADGTPEWLEPEAARQLAADLIAAAAVIEHGLPAGS